MALTALAASALERVGVSFLAKVNLRGVGVCQRTLEREQPVIRRTVRSRFVGHSLILGKRVVVAEDSKAATPFR